MQALRHQVDTGFIDEYDVLLILTCVSTGNAVGDPRSIETLPSIDNDYQLPRHLRPILKESGKTADRQVILLDHSAQLTKTVPFHYWISECRGMPYQSLAATTSGATTSPCVPPSYSHVKLAFP